MNATVRVGEYYHKQKSIYLHRAEPGSIFHIAQGRNELAAFRAAVKEFKAHIKFCETEIAARLKK